MRVPKEMQVVLVALAAAGAVIVFVEAAPLVKAVLLLGGVFGGYLLWTMRAGR